MSNFACSLFAKEKTLLMPRLIVLQNNSMISPWTLHKIHGATMEKTWSNHEAE
ncbi:MAG: hypothetical protein WD038_09220 [Balneolales bacterium]